MRMKSAKFSSCCADYLSVVADSRAIPSRIYKALYLVEISTNTKETFTNPLLELSSFLDCKEPVLGLLAMEILKIYFSKDMRFLLYDKVGFDCIGCSKHSPLQ